MFFSIERDCVLAGVRASVSARACERIHALISTRQQDNVETLSSHLEVHTHLVSE